MFRKVFFLFLCAFFLNCTKETEIPNAEQTANRDLDQILTSDTLRAATMRGASSYFLHRSQILGYNFELISNFAKHLSVELDIQIVNTEQELIRLLSAGEVDIIAYNLFETKERKQDFYFVFPRFASHQVLIQRRGRNSLSNISHLAGKDVHVKENSIFHKRLMNLNDEIGGTINIIFAPDSLTTDDLILMTLNNEIQHTIAFKNHAVLHRNYSQHLNFHVPVGFTQHSGWLIHKNTPKLLTAFETWAKLPATARLQQRLEIRYKMSNPYLARRQTPIPEREISPYDDLFKQFAPEIGWDWRLLAAIAFRESTFNSASVSPVGASGLMQLMPRTAAIFDVDSTMIFDPEINIQTSVAYIGILNRLFRQVESKDERIKFILAGYNSGPFHVIDAMALAKRYGKNPHIWFDNVEYFLYRKKYPDFHQDAVVEFGAFNARETIRFVENVLSTYEKYTRKR